MIIFFIFLDSFKCKLPTDDKYLDKSLNTLVEHIIILSGDSFILFEEMDKNQGKIVFWCNILSITDLQINKSNKTVSINFYEDTENKDFRLKLIIDNIIVFRDTLVSRMNALEIKVVSKMVDPNKGLKKRLTLKDLSRMKLEDIVKNTQDLKQKIEKGEIDNYTVNTFTTLCGKAIEQLNRNNDEIKQFELMNMMKDVLQMEQVKKLTEMEQKPKKEKKELTKDKNTLNNINNNSNNNIISNNKADVINKEDKKEEIKKEETKKEEIKKEEIKKEDEKKEEIKKEETKKEDEKKEEIKKEDEKKEETKKEEIKKEDEKKEETKNEDQKKDDIKEEDTKKEDTKKEEIKKEDQKKDDTKEEDTKKEDTKKEEKKEEDIKKEEIKKTDENNIN